jgi:hypothetical protein
MSERWLPVVGHEGRYTVSDQGRVQSLRVRHRFTDAVRLVPLVLRQSVDERGYRRVGIAGKSRQVHRLVLEAFVGACPVGHEAAHVNGQPSDNRLENLQWLTHAENEQHKVIHGTLLAGERHPFRRRPDLVRRGERNDAAKLTTEQVLEIRAAADRGESYSRLAIRYGVTTGAVSQIARHLRWEHVGGERSPSALRDGRTGTSKLTMVLAEEIRSALAGGESQRSLAARYGVSQTAISLIARNLAWRVPAGVKGLFDDC